MEGACGCLSTEILTNHSCAGRGGGAVSQVCLYLPPSTCLLNALSSLSSSLSLSHPHSLTLSHLLTPSLPPALCSSLTSRPGCFFMGGTLAISPAMAHVLPTQEEKAFSTLEKNPREELQRSRVHLWISHSDQRHGYRGWFSSSQTQSSSQRGVLPWSTVSFSALSLELGRAVAQRK